MSVLPDGYELESNFLNQHQIAQLKKVLDQHLWSDTAGLRNADKKIPTIGDLATSSKFLQKAEQYLQGKPKLVRALLFNKTQENNWLVSWHQDKTICVSERVDIIGWGPWTIKDGTHHVQPPLEILNQMVTFRIHIDDSTLESGCLRLIPKSHLQGILSAQEIQLVSSNEAYINCIATAGALLVMRPHILHASSKASNPSERRVIHLEYSSYLLPEGLQWA